MSNLLDPGTAVFIGAGNFIYQGFVVEALDRVVKLEQGSIYNLHNECLLEEKYIEVPIAKIDFITEDCGEYDHDVQREDAEVSEDEVIGCE